MSFLKLIFYFLPPGTFGQYSFEMWTLRKANNKDPTWFYFSDICTYVSLILLTHPKVAVSTWVHMVYIATIWVWFCLVYKQMAVICSIAFCRTELKIPSNWHLWDFPFFILSCNFQFFLFIWTQFSALTSSVASAATAAIWAVRPIGAYTATAEVPDIFQNKLALLLPLSIYTSNFLPKSYSLPQLISYTNQFQENYCLLIFNIILQSKWGLGASLEKNKKMLESLTVCF